MRAFITTNDSKNKNKTSTNIELIINRKMKSWFLIILQWKYVLQKHGDGVRFSQFLKDFLDSI